MVVIPDQIFRDLLDLFMCSDPWPMEPESNERMTVFLNEQAEAQGYPSWVDAYHQFMKAQCVIPGMEIVGRIRG